MPLSVHVELRASPTESFIGGLSFLDEESNEGWTNKQRHTWPNKTLFQYILASKQLQEIAINALLPHRRRDAPLFVRDKFV